MKWEYRIDKLSYPSAEDEIELFNRNGNDGWELILIEHVSIDTGYWYYFKRLMKEE